MLVLQDEALARAPEKAMERYQDRKEEHPRRLDLGQKIADYHLGITSQLGEHEYCHWHES